MQGLEPPDESSTVELAKERNRAAADRTLLAWIRTSLALIAFGFGIDRIVAVVRAGSHESATGLTQTVAVLFMALGIYAIASASYEYRRQLQMLAQKGYRYSPRKSNTLRIAVILALVGAFALVGIVLQAFLHT
jgi:putative membrane protein